MFNNLFDDFDYDNEMLDGEDEQGWDHPDDFDDPYDDVPDWGEESGWNDVYGSDVDLSDIIEFRD